MNLQFGDITIELSDCGWLPPDPRWSIQAHAHNAFELHFITQGRGINRIAAGEMEFFQNVVYMAPPGELHSQWSDRLSPLELYFMTFRLHSSIPLEPLNRIYSPFPSFHHEILAIMRMQQSAHPGDRFRSKIRLADLVLKVIGPRIYPGAAPEREYAEALTTCPSPGEHPLVEQAVLYVQRHFLANPTLEEIAVYCHVSPRHLSRMFSQYMQTTVHHLIQNERLLWACSQLQHSAQSVVEISDQLSFSSPQYFSQWFKKLLHKTPSEYRLARQS